MDHTLFTIHSETKPILRSKLHVLLLRASADIAASLAFAALSVDHLRLLCFIQRTPQALHNVLGPMGPALQTGVDCAPHAVHA